MIRDSVLLYRSTLEAIKHFPKSKQLASLWAIIDYGLDGTEYTGEGLPMSAYLNAKPLIDSNNKRYENAKKGGAPKGNQNARKQPKTTKKQPKNNQKQPHVDVNVDVDVKEDNNKSELEKTIDDFIEHRKKLKSPMTDNAYKLMMNKLDKLSGGREDIKIEILNQSIENGWKGIFPLKKEGSNRFNNATERNYNMDDLELKLLASN